MPEGDSLRRAEALLAPLLEGQRLTSVWFRRLYGPAPRVGWIVTSVDAVGKHLLISFERGLTLHTHLGMTGSWRIAAPGHVPVNDPRLRVVLAVEEGAALCFAAPKIESFVGDKNSAVAHLGPDLSDDEVDFDAIEEALATADPSQMIAHVLLNQRIACGVGNVFKSETLFVAGVFPFTLLGELSSETRRKIWKVAHQQLVANRDRRFRSTLADGSEGLYVYGRFRLPCRRCSDVIEFDAAGSRTERSTYWCPSCQPRS